MFEMVSESRQRYLARDNAVRKVVCVVACLLLTVIGTFYRQVCYYL